MSDDLKRALDRQSRDLAGPGPMEQHILLLKLTNLLENAPEFGNKPQMDAASPQRQWLAQVGALMSRLGRDKLRQFKASMGTTFQYWTYSIQSIKGQVLDAVEELKLELELEGRSDIGSAYAPGDVYRFFADLKSIVNRSTGEILIIDPYFDGTAFDNYLSEVPAGVRIRIFTNKYSAEVKRYVDKHISQFGSKIEIRESQELHDRLVFLDKSECWIMGASVKDAGKKATYLIPVGAELSATKLSIYEQIWARGSPV